MKTRDWARAVKRAEKLETVPERTRILVSVAEGIASYLGDCRARNLAGSTIESYTKTLEHLSTFCTSKGIRAMDGIDLGVLTDFRAGRMVPGKTENEAPRPISPSMAKVKGHPHRFRDTFSVSLLEKGENLHTVQLLLGHTSIKTTEKHYAPFVESFQRVLDAATSKLGFGTRIGTRERISAKLFKIG